MHPNNAKIRATHPPVSSLNIFTVSFQHGGKDIYRRIEIRREEYVGKKYIQNLCIFMYRSVCEYVFFRYLVWANPLNSSLP